MINFYIGVPPAFIAILIFVYMRNQQAKRNDKLRSRFWKMQERLQNTLSSLKQNNDLKR